MAEIFLDALFEYAFRDRSAEREAAERKRQSEEQAKQAMWAQGAEERDRKEAAARAYQDAEDRREADRIAHELWKRGVDVHADRVQENPNYWRSQGR